VLNYLKRQKKNKKNESMVKTMCSSLRKPGQGVEE
jgi:hypothetical protein